MSSPHKKWQGDGRGGNGNDYIFYMLSTLLLLSFVIIGIQIPTTHNLHFFSLHFNHLASSPAAAAAACQCQSSNATTSLEEEKKKENVESSSSIQKRDELEEALAATATPDKTVIITLVSKAYVQGDKPMFDLFLDGFWMGDGTRDLIKHVLVVAVDPISYQRCLFLHLHCYMLHPTTTTTTEAGGGVNFDAAEEMMFMSFNFVQLVWRRIQFLGDVAKRGYNFIFTDTDILWLKNPFPNLKMDESLDFQISNDYIDRNKDIQQNFVNTGFYMIKSNNKTIALLDAWYENRGDYKRKEQDILVMLLNDGLVNKLGLNFKFLDTVYFSGFCQNSRDVSQIITLHANCCVSITAKVADLITALHDWKRYKKSAATNQDTSSFQWSQHAACINASKNF